MHENKVRIRFRQLLDDPKTRVGVGVYDPFSALVAQKAGVDYISTSGASIAVSLGMPDLGLLTATEIIERNRYIVNAVDVPVIADADTGYGNALNVMRTVRSFEAAGVSGIHIEDQTTPKTCGLLDGVELISCQEMIGKIRAATQVRNDPNFALIARTDSYGSMGIEVASERANAYLAAGADAVMVEGLETYDDYAVATSRVNGPLIASLSYSEHSKSVSVDELGHLGVALAGFPTEMILSAFGAMTGFVEDFVGGASPNAQIRNNAGGQLPELAELYDLVGTQEMQRLAREFEGERVN